MTASVRTFVLLIGAVVLSACDGDAPYYAGFDPITGEPIAACSAEPWRSSPFACAAGAQERTSALTVCGELTTDNTLDVEGDIARACTRGPDVIGGGGPLRVTTPTQLELGDCTYGMSSLDANNTLDVTVRGHATWVIAGSVHIAAPTRVRVEPGATLDLVVGGALALDNTFAIEGDPAASTVYVTGPIHVAAPTRIAGSLFAPESRVDADNTLDIEGAAYLGSLRVAAPMKVRGRRTFSERGCL